MKKLSIAVAVAATLGAGVAGAYTVGVPASGVLVPNVIHGGSDADTTAVGFINHNTSGDDITVYWTFFDQNSKHITDGQFDMTPGDYEPFIWSQESGLGLDNARGYLVFHVGADSQNDDAVQGSISAAAFQLNAASGDAAYIPVFPINRVIGTNPDIAAGASLSTLDENSLTKLDAGAQAGDWVDMRYEMDAHWESRITLWATGGLTTAGGPGVFTVNMFDDDQNRKSVNFTCDKSELCFVDPATIVGRPAEFTRGFIRLNSAQFSEDDGSFVSYTVVTDKAGTYGGATQTILNSHWTPAP